MKFLIILLSLFICADIQAATLNFEGKAGAQISRQLRLPFPIVVEKVFMQVGQDVHDHERLLQYKLEPKDARHLQNELLSGGPLSDLRMQVAQFEREALESGAARQTSSLLAAQGLGSSTEAAKNSRSHALAQERVNALKQKSAAAKADFALRLEELESYLGQALKAGQPLPKELFLTAPIEGTIVELSSQVRKGGLIGANELIATIAALNPLQVQIQVHESEITKLHVGQEATVEAANYENIKVPGKISMLSWMPTDATIAVPSFYFAWVDVENADHALKPGYKVWVHIDEEPK